MKRTSTPIFSRLPGFTYIELVVWGVVLALTAGLLLQFTVTGTQTTARLGAREATIRSTAEAAKDLPALLRRVRPPVWAPTSGWVTGKNGRWVIGYWNGDPTQHLSLGSDDGTTLTAECPDGKWTWGPWTAVRCEPWLVDGRPIGVAVTLTWGPGRLETHWTFGSEPL